MASPIIYLEVDDEITSAASRIREADATRVAVVLPHGSRVATSRINFRLLSRDALTHEKRLSLVSADPATRALAASAGLPVFASVAEYEASLAGIDAEPGAKSATPAPIVAPAIVAGAVTGDVVVDTVRSDVPREPSPAISRRSTEPIARPDAGGGRSTTSATGGQRGIRTPWLIGGGILALAVLVGAVGIYLLLPSATIVVTPRPEPVGPVEIQVVADPSATGPGSDPPVVQAEILTVPVSVEDTFPATGVRVDLTKATGTVRFENLDPTSANRIAAGSVVTTSDGVKFRTDATITVGKADLIGFTIFPGRASVAVTAATGGPDGNVEPNTIVGVPRDESSVFLKVSNPDATTGGTRVEVARVSQEDVDAAMVALQASLQASFDSALEDPSLAADGNRVFPATGILGPSQPSVPAESLVGQEVTEFALGLAATGTVVSADPAPVTAIAEERLRAAIDPDHQLVEGSVAIQVGDAVIVGQTVTFPVTATAQEIAILDPSALEAMVLGKPAGEARAILEPYGDVDLTISPDWTNSVPSFEGRVDLTIGHPVTIETPAPSPSS